MKKKSRFVNKEILYLFMFIIIKDNNASTICETVDTLINNKILIKNTFDECFFHNKKE